MSRYILKFSKERNLKYISHLDLLRLFQRTFKRADMKLSYSQGFNPHAKISFAQPLSLGFESTGEYVEIETEAFIEPAVLIDAINCSAADGLKIQFCNRLNEAVNSAKKTLAAAVTFASYNINGVVPAEIDEDMISAYFKQENIYAEKEKKKKVGRGKTIRISEKVDIKPMLRTFDFKKSSDVNLTGSLLVQTGSNGNLNPEIVLLSFCDFIGIPFEKHMWRITRTDMFFSGENGMIIPMSKFKG